MIWGNNEHYTLRRSEILTLEMKINKINNNKKNLIILMVIVMIMISHLEPPLTQAQLEAFIGLSMLVTCTIPWAKTMVFVHTVLLVTCTKP